MWTLRVKEKRGRREKQEREEKDRDVERQEGVEFEGATKDNTMDWEWEKWTGQAPEGYLREEMAGMCLRIERFERTMPLGCEESGSGLGGGEWA